ncbi:MAG: terpene cyclase/mutase family protein [Candidatus Sumerlaeota bacterium]|nr:terpene cyclase/mutase family protein [Candidatus Sumerlaeota bacterium]
MKAPRGLAGRGVMALGLAAALALALSAGAQPAGSDEDWKQVDAAAKRSVAYLLTQQTDDGAIVEKKQFRITMTSLAIMGLCSVGHKPSDQTKEGAALRKAIAFVLKPESQRADGYFGSQDGARMYGHGIVCLMLSEVLGMGVDEQQDRTIRERLKKGIELILRAQATRKKSREHEGGWRYEPNSDDSDLSVTSWQLIALKAAKNAGMEVPKEAIDKAVDYVKRCYHTRGETKRDSKSPKPAGSADEQEPVGFFSYTPGENHMRFGSGAGGLLALQICGLYDTKEVKGSANHFLDYKLPDMNSEDYFFYGIYYYSQGMHQAGGKYAELARKTVRDVLLKLQEQDGSWRPGKKDKEGGTVYVTSLALLSLSIHYHYLPIYQR